MEGEPAVRDDRLAEMRVFVAVCDMGGFTAAANGLDVSQPSSARTYLTLRSAWVSNCLKDLPEANG